MIHIRALIDQKAINLKSHRGPLIRLMNIQKRKHNSMRKERSYDVSDLWPLDSVWQA